MKFQIMVVSCLWSLCTFQAQAVGLGECTTGMPSLNKPDPVTVALERAERDVSRRRFGPALKATVFRVALEDQVAWALNKEARGGAVNRTRRSLSVVATVIIRTLGAYGPDGKRDSKLLERRTNFRWALSTLRQLAAVDPWAGHELRYAEGLAHWGTRDQALELLEKSHRSRRLDRPSWMVLAALRHAAGDVAGGRAAIKACDAAFKTKRRRCKRTPLGRMKPPSSEGSR